MIDCFVSSNSWYISFASYEGFNSSPLSSINAYWFINKSSFIWSSKSLLISQNAFADVNVNGYTRSDGSYVGGHYRSSPNSSVYDNWSTYGNVNPYTGQKGYKYY